MSALFSPTALVVPFENLRMSDVEAVGGKNASLGEMISQLPGGIRVPTGFATTAHAFRQFLAHAGLAQRINARLAALDTEDVRALAAAGAEIRGWVEAQPFPADLENLRWEIGHFSNITPQPLDLADLVDESPQGWRLQLLRLIIRLPSFKALCCQTLTRLARILKIRIL